MSTAAGPEVARRAALRRLAAPVAVLTVCHNGRPHGTTVSTLTRVSRNPALIGASLRAESVLTRLAVAEGRFSVNVLSGGQDSLARWFADSARPDGAAQFAGLAWHPDPYAGAPLLEGALAHYACRVSGTFVVGDNEVLLGQVVRAVHSGEGDPLLSYEGDLCTGTLRPVQADPGARNAKEKAAL